MDARSEGLGFADTFRDAAIAIRSAEMRLDRLESELLGWGKDGKMVRKP